MNTILNEFSKLFEDGFTLSTQNYPKYNVFKNKDNLVILEIAVAGIPKENLEITSENNRLNIKCFGREVDGQNVYLHKGLTDKSFELSFKLQNGQIVKSANHKDGILSITLEFIEVKDNKHVINIE